MVEGTNKQTLRYLHCIVADERVLDRWSEPEILYFVQYLLNSQDTYETGISPFAAHFGTEDATYFKLPEPIDSSKDTAEYVKLLDANLQLVRELSDKYRSVLVAKRTGSQQPEQQNMYQPGDLVLFQRDRTKPMDTKLTFIYAGPFEVILQVKNDVQCRHLNNGIVQTFHVERLKIFHGTKEQGRTASTLDHDQHVISKILYYRGNPTIRTTVEFYIQFADGTTKWLVWTKDLFDSVPYEDYCRSIPQLYPLLFTAAQSRNLIAVMNKLQITLVVPGNTVYVDIRWFGATWYSTLELPDAYEKTYVLPLKYTHWVANTNERKLHGIFPLTEEQFIFDHYFVYSYGKMKVLTVNVVLINTAFIVKYPKILPDAKRAALLLKYTR
jgi:hypothetical protein